MKCENCNLNIPNDMKFAISNNTCPRCGDNIMAPDRLMMYADLKFALQDVEFIMDKTENIERVIVCILNMFDGMKEELDASEIDEPESEPQQKSPAKAKKRGTKTKKSAKSSTKKALGTSKRSPEPDILLMSPEDFEEDETLRSPTDIEEDELEMPFVNDLDDTYIPSNMSSVNNLNSRDAAHFLEQQRKEKELRDQNALGGGIRRVR